MSFSDRDACFDTGRARVSTRLIEGQFPNYQQLIPSGYPNRLVVPREAFIEAVKRVRLIGRDRDNAPIRLAMSSAGLELTTIVHDVGEAKEALDAKYEGTETTVAFNPEFLLDGLAGHRLGGGRRWRRSTPRSRPSSARPRAATSSTC